jgi:hypothetical protein
VIEALNPGSLMGDFPLSLAVNCGDTSLTSPGTGGGGGAPAGCRGVSDDGRLKGLLEASSDLSAASSSSGKAEGTGFRLIAEGEGGWNEGDGPRGRNDSGISRTGLLRGDFRSSSASSSHHSREPSLSMEDRGVSAPERPGRSACGMLVRELSRWWPALGAAASERVWSVVEAASCHGLSLSRKVSARPLSLSCLFGPELGWYWTSVVAVVWRGWAVHAVGLSAGGEDGYGGFWSRVTILTRDNSLEQTSAMTGTDRN